MTRLLIALPAALALCLLAAGCSPSRRSAPDTSGDGRPHKVLLSVLAGQSTSDAGIEEMINDALRIRVPGVVLDWERMDWGEKFQTQMQAKFAAGDVPDIMIGKAQDVATYYPSGNLARIPPSLLQYVREPSLPAITIDGAAYGIPYNAFYQGVFYNKDLFAKYGLKVPRTRAEMSALVAFFKARHIVPFAAHFEESWYGGNILMQFAIGSVFSATPDWGDRFRLRSVSFSSSPAMQECFAAVREIRDETWSDALAIDQTECDERFARGEAAMYVTGSWTLQNIDTAKPHLRVGIFPYPARNGGARLIFEPNMTFMESSRTLHAAEVDNVLHAVFESKDLASEIFDFTKTSSLLKNIGPEVPLLIQPDIDSYLKAGLVVDATTGNNQLIWSFQEKVANRMFDWLQGKSGLEAVLGFADQNRSLSAP
jgi:ABC-type glycerol-3-phosphate transport system substrate-binding protein